MRGHRRGSGFPRRRALPVADLHTEPAAPTGSAARWICMASPEPFALTLTWTPDSVHGEGRLARADWGMTALPLLAGRTIRIRVSIPLTAAPLNRRMTSGTKTAQFRRPRAIMRCMRLPAALVPLRNSTFRTLWLANVVAWLGTWLQNTGAGWLMTSLAPRATHRRDGAGGDHHAGVPAGAAGRGAGRHRRSQAVPDRHADLDHPRGQSHWRC